MFYVFCGFLIDPHARAHLLTYDARAKSGTFGTCEINAQVQYVMCSINCSIIEQLERCGSLSCLFCRLRRIIRAMVCARALDLNKQLGGYSPQWVLFERGGGGLGSFAVRIEEDRRADRLGAVGDGKRSQCLAVGEVVQMASPIGIVAAESSQRGLRSADFCGLQGLRLLTASLRTARGACRSSWARAATLAEGQRGGASPFGPAPRADGRFDRQDRNLETSAPLPTGCDRQARDQARNAPQSRMGSGVRVRARSGMGGAEKRGIDRKLEKRGFGLAHVSLYGDGASRLGAGAA